MQGYALILEDDPDTLTALSLLLESEGIASRAGALDWTDPPAVALVDLSVEQVFVRVLELQAAGVPLIVISARPRWAVERAADMLGAEGWFAKPFDVPALVGEVRRLAGRTGVLR